MASNQYFRRNAFASSSDGDAEQIILRNEHELYINTNNTHTLKYFIELNGKQKSLMLQSLKHKTKTKTK